MKIKDIPKACPVVNAKRSTPGVNRPREKLAPAIPSFSRNKMFGIKIFL